MQQLFIKWRPWKLDIPMNFGDFTLNGGYSLSFRFNGSRNWYVQNAGVVIHDQMVNDKYIDTGAVSGTPRKDKCFAVIEFDETKITAADLAFDLTNDYSDYGVNVMDKVTAATFLRDFTTCPETA